MINLKLVEVEDAEFILSLRNNPNLNKYISATDVSVENQREWIKKYKLREKNKEEFYFIVINEKTKEKCGTVRIYNLKDKEATWGSFILDSNRPDGASYEVIKKSLDFCFDELRLEKVLLDVRNENKKAIHIYEKAGFIKFDEDEQDGYYFIKKS